MDSSLPHVSQRVVNIASGETQNQQGTTEINVNAIAELSAQEKKELRKQRFNTLGSDPHVTTADALQRLKEEKEKRLARAQKFGIVTKDVEELKRQERAVKFGLISASGVTQKASKEEVDQKRLERAKRFGLASKEEEEDKKR